MDVVLEEEPRGWYSRGYLPHFDGGEIPQFVTFRLEGSVPTVLINRWTIEVHRDGQGDSEARLRRRIEEHLDGGHGPRWLEDPRVASIVERALLFFDGQRYRMHAWVVMPTHVHALFTPFAGNSLERIMHSWKSFSANRCNVLLKLNGPFWQREYFDRAIRDEKHFFSVARYIENNPVKGGLCARADEFRYSSASALRRLEADAPGY